MKAKNVELWIVRRITLLASGTALLAGCQNLVDLNPTVANSVASTSISISPNMTGASKVALGGQVTLTPSGGVPPYYYHLESDIGGAITKQTGGSTTLIAPSVSGIVRVVVSDSSSDPIVRETEVVIEGTVTGNGVLSIPQMPIVLLGNSVDILVEGGRAPYSIQISSPDVGVITGNSFLGQKGGTVVAQVTDMAGNFLSFKIRVYPYSSNAGQTSECSYWSQYYSTPYVPLFLNGQYVCANFDVFNQFGIGTPYFNNSDLYYEFPPYQSDDQVCDNLVAISLGSFYGSVCF